MLPPPRFRSSTVSVVKRRRSRLCRILLVAVPTCVIIALQIHAAGHFEESIELEASAHSRRMAAEASRHVNHASPPAPRASAANGRAQCSRRRRPYHVLVPSSLSVEHQWQARLSYHRYLRLKESDPCSDLGGFTRLLTSPDGKPDLLAAEMPTVVTRQLKRSGRCDECDHGFPLLNRPWAVRRLLAFHRKEVKEEYILLLEADMLLLAPVDNGAEGGAAPLSPVGAESRALKARDLPQIYPRWPEVARDCRARTLSRRPSSGTRPRPCSAAGTRH